jgi:tRNA (guanine26-N2/guanine27-N2)-dimethyltransferase
VNLGFPTEKKNEGLADFLVPKCEALAGEKWRFAPSRAPVFYNPAMELNRDLAVLALQTYQRILRRENLTVCEPLTGCGIRSIRFAMEVEGVQKVIANDINADACRLAKHNVEINGVNEVSVENTDANFLLNQHTAPLTRFDYIDVDPFGSPTPYLDSTVRALRKGGLLALTATDMAPLCGVHWKAGLRKYGGKPLRTEYCHELAVRLLIGCLATTAAKHNFGITVLLSYSDSNYVRTYTLLKNGAKEADKSIQMMGYILHCFECFHRENFSKISSLDLRCPECGFKMSLAGPLWLGELLDESFCTKMQCELEKKNLRLRKKLSKLLSLNISEAKATATYYVIDKLCDKFNLPIPAVSDVMAELKKMGFQASNTHFNTKAVKTNAPSKSIKDILILLTNSRKTLKNDLSGAC